MIEKPEWTGRTVVCIASGPSMTREDCNLVRASGHPAVVTNTMFQWCPWADALFAFDTNWWRHYHAEVQATFKGRRFAASPVAAKYGAEVVTGCGWFCGFRNSGASAVSLAIGAGAAKVVMLGFDAGFYKGRRHCHGDHPKGMGNADSIPSWGFQFDRLAKHARRHGAEIVNASRRTALRQFQRADLEDVI